MRDCGFFSDKDKEEVLKIMNVDEQDLKRDINILKEWLKKQLHLPQGIQDDFFFQNILIRNKCRVEKAKDCIDFYYTSRTIWPEMYQNIRDIVPSRHNMRNIPLRSLGKQKERIILNITANPDASIYHFQDLCDILIATWELQLKYDCSAATRIVYDFQNFNAEMITRIPSSTMVKLDKIFRNAYSCRLIGIEYYRPKGLISTVLKIVRTFLPQKVYDRITVHDNLDSLVEVIPQEILPKEYGGQDKSIPEILAEQDEVYDEHRELFEELTTVKSNEKLRLEKSSYNLDMYGVEGTFKKLSLD